MLHCQPGISSCWLDISLKMLDTRWTIGLLSCRQWSWPLPLPPQLFGIFPAGVLTDRDETVPWAADLEQRTYTGSVSEPCHSEIL